MPVSVPRPHFSRGDAAVPWRSDQNQSVSPQAVAPDFCHRWLVAACSEPPSLLVFGTLSPGTGQMGDGATSTMLASRRWFYKFDIVRFSS